MASLCFYPVDNWLKLMESMAAVVMAWALSMKGTAFIKHLMGVL
jgi:hypothetical protein